jgi:hypothetical protein
MNVPMLRHYELQQQQQLAQPPENHHTSNQHPSQMKENLMAVGTNFTHLFSTYV